MIHPILEQRLREAVGQVFPDADPGALVLQPCPDPRFGDYQCNGLIALAKARGLNPRQAATDVVGRLHVGEWCELTEVAGGGFVNFRLRSSAVGRILAEAARGEHLFMRPAQDARTVVVDFSSPNVAKAMHVGHIRSTILGDCLARVLRRLGHRVITDNHLGDWGTQFGKLLVGWREDLDRAQLEAAPLAEMERLYRRVNTACQTDPSVLERARQALVKLQGGDPECVAIWRQMIEYSRQEFDAIYGRLGVRFDQTLGESFYNPRLKSVVEDLVARGVARESEGAQVVFFDDVPDLQRHPVIVQKSDGAANYMTTDLATLAYRFETWRPQEVIYVTDARQQLHFRQLFATFRRWHPEANLTLAHVWFGSILGENGKPLKTRAGDTIPLAALLDEAEEQGYRVVCEKNPDLAEARKREIARIVGIGAVKYADLQPNRQSDYVFSWDKLLALNGNTAPYLQYAYTRIRSIFRKGGLENGSVGDGHGSNFGLTAPEEIALGKHLLNFGWVLEAVGREYRPNFLCNFLYELAGHFTRFYEQCPVLKAEPGVRSMRLALCELTARVLETGLDLLGIETTDQM